MTLSERIELIEARPCGFQRRPAHEYRSATVSGTPWSNCPASEATDMFERWPGFEYRAIYADAELLAAARKAEALEQRAEAAEALADRLKREAQFHAMEARTANSTIYEIYQVVSGGKGEPGNWNGAEPVREKLEALERKNAEFRAMLERCAPPEQSKSWLPIPLWLEARTLLNGGSDA